MSNNTISWYYPDRSSHKDILFVFQEGKCNSCRINFEKTELTIDHIKPQAANGTGEIVNKQLLCLDCHTKKTHRDVKIIKDYRAYRKYAELTN